MASVSDYEEITDEERQQLLRSTPPRHYTSTIQQKENRDRSSQRSVHFRSPHEENESPTNELTESMSVLETPTTYAINVCRKKVIAPYRILLLLVGWEPVFEDDNTNCKKAVNVIHPIIVMLLVLLGYIIQFASCFRRDNLPPHKLDPILPENVSEANVTISDLPPAFATCYGKAISQYLIPDLFHSAAYLYSFYIMRFNQRENLTSLVMRTFLQTSPTQAGFWSQRRLIRAMRIALWSCVIWLVLSLACQIIHVVAMYNELIFKWFNPRCAFSKLTLVIFMLVSFMALSVVYVVVVLNYCCQCMLLIFYIEGLQEKIKRGEFQLIRGMQEIQEIQEHLDVLNYKTGVALSIVVFNFGTMAVLEHGFWWAIGPLFYTILTPRMKCMVYASMGLSIFSWVTIMIVPFIQAARLSAACNKLRKMGHEIRVKAFAHQNADPKHLDSFLLFTSSLNLRAKIFLIPVKTSYISAVIVISVFVVLLLFQTGVIQLWIKI